MNTDEISNAIVEKEKELQVAMANLNIIEAEDNRLTLAIAELQLQKKKNQSGLIQGKYNVRRIASEKRALERQYWDSRP